MAQGRGGRSRRARSASRTSTARSSSAAGRSTRWHRCRTSSRSCAGTTWTSSCRGSPPRGRRPGVCRSRRASSPAGTRPTHVPRTTGGAKSSRPAAGRRRAARGAAGGDRGAARRHHGPARDRLGDRLAGRTAATAHALRRERARQLGGRRDRARRGDAGGDRRGVLRPAQVAQHDQGKDHEQTPPTTTAMPIRRRSPGAGFRRSPGPLRTPRSAGGS